jgi:hypothetical protein
MRVFAMSNGCETTADTKPATAPTSEYCYSCCRLVGPATAPTSEYCYSCCRLVGPATAPTSEYRYGRCGSAAVRVGRLACNEVDDRHLLGLLPLAYIAI